MVKLLFIKLILSLPWMIWLSLSDCRTRHLPNSWVLGGGLVALAVSFGVGISYGLGALLTGVFCSLFLLLPFFLRAAGAGDVKMLFVAGIIAGPGHALNLIFLVSIAGFLLAVFFLIWRHVDASRLKHYFHCCFDFKYDRSAGRASLPSANEEKCRVPFGVAISAGLFLNLLVQLYFIWGGESA